MFRRLRLNIDEILCVVLVTMFCLTRRMNNKIVFYQIEETKVEKKSFIKPSFPAHLCLCFFCVLDYTIESCNTDETLFINFVESYNDVILSVKMI